MGKEARLRLEVRAGEQRRIQARGRIEWKFTRKMPI